LNVGTFVSGKGQDVLLKAFARIADHHPDLGLVFVGGRDRGVWLEELRTLAKRLAIADRVRFLTDQPQAAVARLMLDATCLAHAALQEAFGLVLIEAGACRLPVVATRTGGIPEIIRPGMDGLLVAPRDVDAMADALDETIRNPDASLARAECFVSRIQERFSLEAMTRAYLDVYASARPQVAA
jgi:glycosyltransferase involved in cell wall biosynthesis